jgi:predicted nucleic acid-binding protein
MVTLVVAIPDTIPLPAGRDGEKGPDLVDVAESAGARGRRFLSSHPGIEVTDLIVEALAQHLDAELKTTNVKHFPMFKGLKAPY